MENKPTIQEANNEVIQRFFFMYGEDTKERMTAMVFDMALCTIIDMSEVPQTREGAEIMVSNLRLLNALVSDLQDPRK